MDLSTVDDRVQELAVRAMKKSGNQFFQTLQKRVTAYIELLVAESVDADDMDDAKDQCTPENVVLLARHYAGDIAQPKKRKRGVPTNAEKVKTLLSNVPVRLVLEPIVLSAHLEAAQNECNLREANAGESEHWARDYADMDPSDMWAQRNEAIDLVKSSWDEAAEAAKSGDWEELVSAMGGLDELDA